VAGGGNFKAERLGGLEAWPLADLRVDVRPAPLRDLYASLKDHFASVSLKFI
jgi:hypothetical protein